MAAMSEKNGDDAIKNAEEVIERFGGIRPMASKMDVPVTTVQGWKKRNVIPGNRRDQVMEAAASNNIDLSDLVSGAANENTFSTELSVASLTTDRDTEERHEEAVLMAQKRTEHSAEGGAVNAAMLEEMKKAQSMTFTKSAWFTGAVVAIVVVLSIVLLWPSKQQIDRNATDITKLDSEVSAVKEKQSFLGALIPDDIEQRIQSVQQQAETIQGTVTDLTETVEEIKTDVMDPNATMGERLERLEEHAVELGAPLKLTNMLQKVQEMQQSLEGQTQLSSAISELNMLFQSTQGDEAGLEAALVQAQQEDDALGQALQGVPQQDLKAAALLLGLSQFRSSMHRSAPFEEDLALMQKMLGEDDTELQAAITKLAPKAASGVLTPEGLKGEFKGLAGDIVVSSLKGEDVSIQERAKARFNEVLTVEKDGELLTGTDTQAKVARAQKMLDEGNIEGALAELQSLEGEAAETAQPFIDEAQITLLAEQLQGMFASKVATRVGGLGITARGGGGMNQLMNEIKKLQPPRRTIGDSNFRILEPKPKYTP